MQRSKVFNNNSKNHISLSSVSEVRMSREYTNDEHTSSLFIAQSPQSTSSKFNKGTKVKHQESKQKSKKSLNEGNSTKSRSKLHQEIMPELSQKIEP